MTNSHSMLHNWRPVLCWSYVIICMYDFCIGPIIYNVLQYLNPGQNISGWQAITLQSGGLYHLSMGTFIGISSHGRTQETLADKALNQDSK